jgi:hypothetical protein
VSEEPACSKAAQKNITKNAEIKMTMILLRSNGESDLSVTINPQIAMGIP